MNRIIAVTGFSRSGTSLTMRMLHMGGLEVVAENHASYEEPRANVMAARNDGQWLRECRGKAVKLLEPQHLPLPRDLPYDFIWCRRDPVEQGKSQIKFLGLPVTRRAALDMAMGVIEDTPRVQKQLQGFPDARLKVIEFERLIDSPHEVATELARFLNRPLDVTAMAKEVIPRSAACYPGLLELQWLDR